MKKSQEIINKYKGKLLGVMDWANPKQREFYVEDFIDKKKLINFIYDVEDAEASFTEDTSDFLEEYYGIHNLAKELYELDPAYPNKSVLENELMLERSGHYHLTFLIPDLRFEKFKIIYQKYKNKILLRDISTGIVAIDELMDYHTVMNYLSKIFLKKAVLTKDGYDFFEECYGVKNIISVFISKDRIDPYRSHKEYESRLEKMEQDFKNLII